MQQEKIKNSNENKNWLWRSIGNHLQYLELNLLVNEYKIIRNVVTKYN